LNGLIGLIGLIGLHRQLKGVMESLLPEGNPNPGPFGLDSSIKRIKSFKLNQPITNQPIN